MLSITPILSLTFVFLLAASTAIGRVADLPSPAVIGVSGVGTSAVCSAGQLKLASGEEEGDMGGKRYLSFVFTNKGTSACTLKGFPRFELLDKRGRALVGQKTSYTDHLPNMNDAQAKANGAIVKLSPGGSAWFQIYYNDGMALSHRRPYPKAAKVLISPPGVAKTFILMSDIRPCCGVLVSSIRPGSPE